MEGKDYYRELGVSYGASQQEIKRAYRRLARECHPDLHWSNRKQMEERFKEINEAHEVLSNSEKRSRYDRYFYPHRSAGSCGAAAGYDWAAWARQRTAAAAGAPAACHRGSSDGYTATSYSTAKSRSAESGTAGVNAGESSARGQDVECHIQVTLREAYSGSIRMISRNQRQIQVSIPVGVYNGSRVRIRGGGEPGSNGGEPGDLYVIITVLPDSQIERRGNDLYMTLPVAFDVAARGGEVKVASIGGDVLLTIPPDTVSGQKFRLRGKGMPNLRNPRECGDLIVTIAVTAHNTVPISSPRPALSHAA